jgi:hypothetical protein
MTRCFADFVPRLAVRGSAAVLAGAILVAACATGIAAFAGLLPKSEGVAAAVTATPLVEMQTSVINLVESRTADTAAASE